MRLHAGSFLLGLTAAAVVPVLTRFFRPVAVQLTAAGMMAFDDARRIAAEQFEVMQDIAAEAKARRGELLEAQADAEERTNGRPRAPRRRGAASGQPKRSKVAGDST